MSAGSIWNLTGQFARFQIDNLEPCCTGDVRAVCAGVDKNVVPSAIAADGHSADDAIGVGLRYCCWTKENASAGNNNRQAQNRVCEFYFHKPPEMAQTCWPADIDFFKHVSGYSVIRSR